MSQVNLESTTVTIDTIAGELGVQGDELVHGIRTRRTQTGHGT